MDRNGIIELINKYLSNSCTKEEALFLEEWYKSVHSKDDFLERFSDEEKNRIENRIFSKIKDKTSDRSIPSSRNALYLSNRFSPVGRYVVAAVFFIALFLSGTFYVFNNADSSLHYSTGYGETRRIVLPDSSTVILNANSSLSAKAFNGNENVRSVNLQGEAFFEVTSTDDNAKFIVNTDNLSIEVLGTRFNVNTRRHNSQVILQEGQVKLGIEGTDWVNQELIMKPGELVEYNSDKKQVNKRMVEVRKYISWIDNEFIFDGTSLTKIADLIGDHYGYEVVMKDSTLPDKKFHGNSPADDLNVLLDKLAKIYDLNIVKDGNQLIFKKR